MSELRTEKSSQTETPAASEHSIQSRIDPEIVHGIFYIDDTAEGIRRSDFWDHVDGSYSGPVRGILHRASQIRTSEGDQVAEAYIKGATDVMQSFSQQDQLHDDLASQRAA
jgi:hypothetical protein